MELKHGLLVVLFMAQSFNVMGAFVKQHDPMNNQRWKESEGDRLSLYNLLHDTASSDETKQGCIATLLKQLFAADPFCLKENIEELLHYALPKDELLKATVFAIHVIARDQMKKVHPLERWTLMHYAAYAFAQRYQLDKDLRKNGPLSVGHYVPDDCCNTITFLTELGIAVTVEAYYENWQPHNLYDAFVKDITVTPADVVTRFSQEGDAVREIFSSIK